MYAKLFLAVFLEKYAFRSEFHTLQFGTVGVHLKMTKPILPFHGITLFFQKLLPHSVGDWFFDDEMYKNAKKCQKCSF